MLRYLFAAAIVGVCLSIPAPDLTDEVHSQALASMHKSETGGQLKQFLPLINQVVVYTGVILPSVKANKEHKKVNEMTEAMLMQTYTDAAGSGLAAQIEAALPTADDMLTAMVAIGNVIGGSSGYNPISMMTNIVGRDEMVKAIDLVMKFPLRFPEPTNEEIFAAEQAAISIGLGFDNQEAAIDHFIDSISQDKKDMISQLETEVIDKIMNAMTTPDGNPTQALVEEVKRQMREMEKRKGNTDMMPEEFKELVRQAVDTASQTPQGKSLEEQAQSQALVALQASKKNDQFKDLLPLVNQVMIYTSAVLPSIKAKKENKHTSELSSSMLLQTLNEASGEHKTVTTSDLEAILPTAEDILNAMLAIGNVVGGSSGYNPIEILSNTVGKEDMAKIIDEVMKFPLRFPDPTDSEIAAAEQVVINVGLGFGSQEQAIDQFLNSLSKEKVDMINSLQKNVIDKMINSMVTKEGKPTQAFVEEIKRQMREMEKRKGSTALMPDELKEAVRDAANVQALVAIESQTSKKQFKDFLPLMNQIVVYTGAVLPSVKARKQHKHNSELSASMLVQTVAEAAGQNSLAHELEEALPSADDMLSAMVAIGNVMGGSSGFNPIKMTSNLVGKENMTAIIDEIMKFPLRFADPNDEQLSAAEEVVLAAGLGFGNQEQAIEHFINSLSKDQKDALESMQKNVVDRLMNSMMTPSGEPTPALVEEIKSEMREMEKTKGNTDMMPEELKDLVRTRVG